MVDRLSGLDQFLQKKPLLYRKLCYWAKQRGAEDPTAEVQEYLTELIFKASEYDYESRLKKWTPVLLPQEQIELIHLGPIWVSDYPSGEQWYTLQKGEYSVTHERIIHEIRCEGQQQGLITRNRYNCSILNCPRMMIVDVDIRAPENEEVQDCAPSCKTATSEAHAIKAVKDLVAQFPSLGFRCYRTRNGMRQICTTNLFDPVDADTHQLMAALQVDPLYARLCRFQATFRARLTPKPWRVDENYVEGRLFYDRTTGLVLPEIAPYAVGHLLAIVGRDRILPEFEQLIKVHDAHCRHDRLELELA